MTKNSKNITQNIPRFVHEIFKHIIIKFHFLFPTTSTVFSFFSFSDIHSDHLNMLVFEVHP